MKDLSSTSVTSTLRFCTGDTKPPEHVLLKTFKKNYRTAGKQKPALKDLMHRVTQCGNQHKNTRKKNTQTTGEGKRWEKTRQNPNVKKESCRRFVEKES